MMLFEPHYKLERKHYASHSNALSVIAMLPLLARIGFKKKDAKVQKFNRLLSLLGVHAYYIGL